MKQPRPGELRDLVQIRRRADMPTAGGGVAASFTGERYADAKIEPVGTAVYQAGVQTDDRITHRVFLRSEMAAGGDQAAEIVCDEELSTASSAPPISAASGGSRLLR